MQLVDLEELPVAFKDFGRSPREFQSRSTRMAVIDMD